jgi:hypothetical protein
VLQCRRVRARPFASPELADGVVQELLRAHRAAWPEAIMHDPMRTFCRLFAAVCVLLLQDLLQSYSRGGGGRVEDMCYEIRRAEACVD